MIKKCLKETLTIFLIFIDFAFKKDENCHPQVFFKKCKFIKKEKKVIIYINVDLEYSSDNFWQRID